MSSPRDIVAIGGSRGVTIPKEWFTLRDIAGSNIPDGFVLMAHTEEDIVLLVPEVLENEAKNVLKRFVNKIQKLKKVR